RLPLVPSELLPAGAQPPPERAASHLVACVREQLLSAGPISRRYRQCNSPALSTRSATPSLDQASSGLHSRRRQARSDRRTHPSQLLGRLLSGIASRLARRPVRAPLPHAARTQAASSLDCRDLYQRRSALRACGPAALSVSATQGQGQPARQELQALPIEA